MFMGAVGRTESRGRWWGQNKCTEIIEVPEPRCPGHVLGWPREARHQVQSNVAGEPLWRTWLSELGSEGRKRKRLKQSTKVKTLQTYSARSWAEGPAWEQRTGEQARAEGERIRENSGEHLPCHSLPPSLGLRFQFPKHARSKLFPESPNMPRMHTFLLFLLSHVPILLSGWQQIERLREHTQAHACPLANHC